MRATTRRDRGSVKRLHTFLGLAALLVAGCGELGVGDPCAPQRPGGLPCPSPDGGTSGCFAGTEIYIETQSLACRSRICVVYKYSEETDPRGTDRSKHVYCTCRCGVPPSLAASTDESVLCQCPESFTCLSIANEQYGPGVQGSYCIRTETATR